MGTIKLLKIGPLACHSCIAGHANHPHCENVLLTKMLEEANVKIVIRGEEGFKYFYENVGYIYGEDNIRKALKVIARWAGRELPATEDIREMFNALAPMWGLGMELIEEEENRNRGEDGAHDKGITRNPPPLNAR